MAAHAPLDTWTETHRPDLSTPHLQTAKYQGRSSGTVELQRESGRWIEFRHRARFWWKTALLAITTLALIPILLYQHEWGAQVYLWFLVGVHVVGLAVFAWGVSREDVAPSTWGFAGRIIGLVVVAVLLYFVSKGLQGTVGTAVFWISLFAIWAIHTAGLALLHLRGKAETNCPFV